MDEDRFERLLRETAAAYHRPPEPPRQAMWERLQRARAAQRPQPRPHRATRFHPLLWITGIAALLAIGIGLGRLSVRRPAAPDVAVVPLVDSSANAVAYRVTMAEHLAQTEVFLTLFRMSVRRGAVDPFAPATARPLLATSRLLIDSPVGTDPGSRTLLEDLELVLARIAQLPPQPMAEELELITSGIEQTGVMVRLRSQVPAGPSFPGL